MAEASGLISDTINFGLHARRHSGASQLICPLDHQFGQGRRDWAAKDNLLWVLDRRDRVHHAIVGWGDFIQSLQHSRPFRVEVFSRIDDRRHFQIRHRGCRHRVDEQACNARHPQKSQEDFFNADLKELGYLPNRVVPQQSPDELKRRLGHSRDIDHRDQFRPSRSDHRRGEAKRL